MKSIASVIQLLNNFLYIATAYNQIWTIRMTTVNELPGIAIFDERSGLVKMTFHNSDETFLAAAAEIQKNGWHETKMKYLTSIGFDESRVHLCDGECKCSCHYT